MPDLTAPDPAAFDTIGREVRVGTAQVFAAAASSPPGDGGRRRIGHPAMVTLAGNAPKGAGMTSSRLPDRRWLGALILAWGAAAAVMLWYKWGAIHWFTLGDTDDNIRFAQVRDWLAGQGWYDLRQYHLDPPGGASIHWSRLVDLPIAGVILLVRPFAGPFVANKAAVAIAPLLPMLPAMIGAALCARRLVSPRAWALATALVLCGQSALFMWMPLRIDHHGWQLALLILTVAGVADPRPLRGGVTMGLATALSLTIGLEMLPYFAIATAAVALRWVAEPGDRARLAGYGTSLAAGAAIGFTLFASNDNRAPFCDALSPVWLSDALLGGGLAVGLALLRPADWRVRLALAAAVGGVLGGFHVVAWPQCLGRPENVSPELVRLWLGNVKEARPIYAHDWRLALPVVALPLSGVIGAVWATWRARGTARLVPWAASALFGLSSFAMLFWQMRAGPAAQLLAVPGATALGWRILPGLVSRPRRAMGLIAAPMVFVAVSGLWMTFIVRAVPPAPARTKIGLKPGAPDRSRFCGALTSLRPVGRLAPATFLTFVDFGPRLIATTGHSAIAGPYHRNGAAILDVHHAFRGPAAVAHDVIRRHGVTYVLTCPGMAESTIYASQAPRGFYMMLERGTAPAWLERVPLTPATNPLKLWRVIG